MTANPPEPSLHGGPRRIVELAARALGFASGQATLLEDDGRQVVVTVGPVGDTEEQLFDQVADDVLAQRLVATDDAAGVALLDGDGEVVGSLAVLGRGPEPWLEGTDIEAVLRAFADVLGDQLDLMHHIRRLRVDGSATEDLSRAIDGGEIIPWYQPVLQMTTGDLIGFEALARWQRPTGQIERPGSFIGLAEESGLITRLDLAVMAQAMQDLSRWTELRPDLRMSVNFSGRHLSNPSWADEVHALAQRAGVSPDNVDVELTETARPDNITSGAEQLRRLQELGYAIWLDDFGTGWSELQHLVQLPVDGVKIDRFFAEALGGRADAVVRALTKAAEELGLGTTIEGISQPEHATRAIALGCDIAQGFLYSRPLPAAAAEQLVRSPRPVFKAAAR